MHVLCGEGIQLYIMVPVTAFLSSIIRHSADCTNPSPRPPLINSYSLAISARMCQNNHNFDFCLFNPVGKFSRIQMHYYINPLSSKDHSHPTTRQES